MGTRNSNRNLAKRQFVIIGIFILVGAIYLLKLFSIQVLDKSWEQTADNNVLRFVTQYPARGKVFDRNGELLVYNEAVYDLMVVPGQVKEIDTVEFCQLLGISCETFAENMKKAKKYSRIKASVFVSQISKEDYAHIVEILYRYPGFYFQTRTLRHYPKAIAAHTLGDIGEVNKEVWRRTRIIKWVTTSASRVLRSSMKRNFEGKKVLGSSWWMSTTGKKAVIATGSWIRCQFQVKISIWALMQSCKNTVNN